MLAKKGTGRYGSHFGSLSSKLIEVEKSGLCTSGEIALRLMHRKLTN